MTEIAQHTSICRFCSCGCPVTVEMHDGQPVKVTGEKSSPTYFGFCCSRGQALPEHMQHPDRLLHPVKRVSNHTFEPTSSKQAMDEISERISALGLSHGAPITLRSRHGTIQSIVTEDRDLRRGVVSMTHAFGDLPDGERDVSRYGSNTGVLTSVEYLYDRYSGIPRMNAVPISVEPALDGLIPTARARSHR